MAKEKEAAETKPTAGSTGTNVPVVKWDDSGMSTTYANVCNVTGNREEVGLLFGTNQTLYSGQKEVTVKVTNRIVLSPFAAKRLLKLMENVIRQYENRFGTLEIGIK